MHALTSNPHDFDEISSAFIDKRQFGYTVSKEPNRPIIGFRSYRNDEQDHNLFHGRANSESLG